MSFFRLCLLLVLTLRGAAGEPLRPNVIWVMADDLFADEVMKCLAAPRAKPFFIFWSMVVPHANNERNRGLKNGTEVPDLGPYKDKDWPDADKGQAAMVTRMDSYATVSSVAGERNAPFRNFAATL